MPTVAALISQPAALTTDISYNTYKTEGVDPHLPAEQRIMALVGKAMGIDPFNFFVSLYSARSVSSAAMRWQRQKTSILP